MKYRFHLSLLLLLLATSGCIIEESVGPVGPQGPAGNANVFSHNFLLTMDDATFNGTVASVQFEVPDLNASVVDDGAILMFFRDQGTWTAMPYTFGVESQDLPAVDYTISMGFGYDIGFLEIFYEASTTAVDLGAMPDRDIKLVVIDGYAYGKKGVDMTNWDAVRAEYGLLDN